MLDTYLKRSLTLERYRSGPVGPHLDPFTDWLEARGYQPGRIHRLLHGLQHFSLWAHVVSSPKGCQGYRSDTV
jgi:hypothetical protein